MALVEATLFSQPIPPKSAMHGIGFELIQKSHQNMLEKMDRPDQLIFQIGIIKVWKDLFSSDLQIQKSPSLSTEALNMAGVERFELPTRGFGI
ncbi:hypothetical protein ACEV9R_21475, partial [Vibrio parahaemolyticus]